MKRNYTNGPIKLMTWWSYLRFHLGKKGNFWLFSYFDRYGRHKEVQIFKCHNYNKENIKFHLY